MFACSYEIIYHLISRTSETLSLWLKLSVCILLLGNLPENKIHIWLIPTSILVATLVIGNRWKIPIGICPSTKEVGWFIVKRCLIEPKGKEYIQVLETDYNHIFEPYRKCKTLLFLEIFILLGCAESWLRHVGSSIFLWYAVLWLWRMHS